MIKIMSPSSDKSAFDGVCRICLEVKLDLVSIFDETFIIEGIAISQLLTECTRYKVNPFDMLPHQICGDCIKMAKIAFKFKKQCEDSYRILTNLLNTVNDKNTNYKNQTSVDSSTQTEMIGLHTLKRCSKNICSVCDKPFSRLWQLRRHTLDVHSDMLFISDISCNFCGRRFARGSHLKSHLDSVHKDEYQITEYNSIKTDKSGNDTNSTESIDKNIEKRAIKMNPASNNNNFALVVNKIFTSDIGDATTKNQSKIEADLPSSNIFQFESSFMNSSSSNTENHSSLQTKIQHSFPTDVAMETDLQERRISCHLCKRNFFTKEYLIRHLFEIHNHNNECSKEVLNKNNDVNCNSLNEDNFLNNLKVKFEEFIKIEPTDSIITVLENPSFNMEINTQSIYETSCTEKVPKCKVAADKENYNVLKTVKDNASEINPLEAYNSFGDENDKNNTIPCSTCSCTFGNMGSLKRHRLAKICEMRDEKYFCSICGEGSKNSANPLEHKKSHKDKNNGNKSKTNNKVNSCDKCKRTFSQKSNLNRHISQNCKGTVQEVRTYICLICGSAFMRNESLLKHIRRHNSVKRHKCQYCDKRYIFAHELKHHERFHTGTKPFQCIRCKKRFFWASELKNHIRVHNGERPFKCKQCPKSFKNKVNLNGHIRVHTGERFKCNQCDATFLQIPSLRRHILIKHLTRVSSKYELQKFYSHSVVLSISQPKINATNEVSTSTKENASIQKNQVRS